MIKQPCAYEYEFEPGQDEAWIKVKNFNVHIHKTDEGIVVDVWGTEDELHEAPIATTYAFDSEALECCEQLGRGDEIGLRKGG